MSVMELPQACGYTASECVGLTSDKVVSTTAQDLIVADPYTVYQAPGVRTEVQAAPKVYNSN